MIPSQKRQKEVSILQSYHRTNCPGSPKTDRRFVAVAACEATPDCLAFAFARPRRWYRHHQWSYRWSRCLHLRTRRRQRRRHNRQKHRDLARLEFAAEIGQKRTKLSVVVRRKNPSTDPRRMLVARAVALAACKTDAAVAHIPRKFVAADTKAGQTSMAHAVAAVVGKNQSPSWQHRRRRSQRYRSFAVAADTTMAHRIVAAAVDVAAAAGAKVLRSNVAAAVAGLLLLLLLRTTTIRIERIHTYLLLLLLLLRRRRGQIHIVRRRRPGCCCC